MKKTIYEGMSFAVTASSSKKDTFISTNKTAKSGRPLSIKSIRLVHDGNSDDITINSVFNKTTGEQLVKDVQGMLCYIPALGVSNLPFEVNSKLGEIECEFLNGSGSTVNVYLIFEMVED